MEGRRPAVLSRKTLLFALGLHLALFGFFYSYAKIHMLFAKKAPEPIQLLDLIVVVNENLDGKDNEPPPLDDPPPPPKPQPKPKPKPKPAVKKPDPPKELDKVVTNVVTKVDKKDEKKPEPPKKDKPKKEPPKKPEPPKKSAKELREERMRKMRDSAKKVKIRVKNQPSGDGRTAKKTLTDAEVMKLLNQGYKPGRTEQIATSEMQRCLSLVQMALREKWDRATPKVGKSGIVLLSVQFNSAGGLVNVRVAQSCGDRLSDEAALSVARQVTSIPGLGAEFISQFRKEVLTIRYRVEGR